MFPEQWLKDGSVLFLNTGGLSFYRLSASAGSKPETLLKTTYFKDGPRVSPDGRWVVYSTDESGRWEVYIASFPAFTDRQQISNGGGVQGHWHHSGERLFYLTLDGKIMALPVKTGSPPETGMPVELFQTRASVSPTAEQFSVLRDGRFLVLDAVEPPNKAFTVVMNWPSLAKP
jgi:Tol biopolymer transport system component